MARRVCSCRHAQAASSNAWRAKIAAIVALPAVQEKLRNLGVEPDGRQSDAFSAFQRAEIAKWGKVIQDAGIQAE